MGVDLVQQEFVVDLVELSSEGGGHDGWDVKSSSRVDHGRNSPVHILQVHHSSVVESALSVGWLVEKLLHGGVLVIGVPVLSLEDFSLGGVALLGEQLDLGYDVLVEEGWGHEVLLESWDGPELLEQDGLNVFHEGDGVFLPELSEEGDVVVLTEQLSGSDFLKGHH